MIFGSSAESAREIDGKSRFIRLLVVCLVVPSILLAQPAEKNTIVGVWQVKMAAAGQSKSQRLANGLATHRFPYPGGLVAARGYDPFPIWTKGRAPYVFIMVHCLADRFSAGRLPKPGSLVRARRDYPFSVRTKACAVDNASVS
jgi:hypothetical protein